MVDGQITATKELYASKVWQKNAYIFLHLNEFSSVQENLHVENIKYILIVGY